MIRRARAYQTRFNWDIRLKPGVNEIRIPVETIRKAIDISKIQTVHLFLVESKERTRFLPGQYSGRVKLRGGSMNFFEKTLFQWTQSSER